MEAATSTAARDPIFTKDLKIFLTEEQDAWLAQEAQRRLDLVRAGDPAAFVGLRDTAHGGNRNINKGMLIREAIERLRTTP